MILEVGEFIVNRIPYLPNNGIETDLPKRYALCPAAHARRWAYR